MKVSLKKKERSSYLMLLGAYAVLVAARFLLALVTSAYPTINIDEFLYYGLARSIAAGEGLMFRGQSADYVYVIYPLLLSPVYALFGQTGNVYRILQLWNILIMNLAIFPLYALGRQMIGSEKKAFRLAVCMMLLPDFIMGEMLLSEAILYPVFFAMAYMAYCCLKAHKWQYMLCTGVLGGILYAIKPGYIVAPAVTLAACAVYAVLEKKKGEILHVLLGAAAMACTIGVFYALAYALGYRSGALAVYEQQLSTVHPDAFLRAVLKYPYYFIMACGVFAFVLPLRMYGGYAKETKRLYWIVMLALAGTMLGTSWVINGHEYATNTVHMRYIGVYIPLIMLFCFAERPQEKSKGNNKNKGTRQGLQKAEILPYAAIGFTVLCTLLLGCGAGMDAGATAASNFALAILNKAILPQNRAILGSLIVIAVCVMAIIGVRQWKDEKLRRVSLGMMLTLFVLSSVAGYSLMHREMVFSRIEESRILAEQIGDQEYLYVTTDEKIINNASLDVNSHNDAHYVALNDLFNHAYETGGLYEPFIPWAMRGQIADTLTPQTNLLIFEPTAFSMVKPSGNAKITTTPSKHLYLVEIPQDGYWADSIIANVEMNRLEAGESGVLVVFNDALISGGLTVRMEIEAQENTSLSFFSNAESQQQEIAAGRGWYEFTFNQSQKAYNFICEQSELTIYRYELVPGNP